MYVCLFFNQLFNLLPIFLAKYKRMKEVSKPLHSTVYRYKFIYNFSLIRKFTCNLLLVNTNINLIKTGKSVKS